MLPMMMKSEPMTVTSPAEPTPSPFDDLLAELTPSPGSYNVNMNDELNDLLEIAAEEYKMDPGAPDEPALEVVEDPMDPWNSVNSVWEQPLASVGMDFNFDPSQNPPMPVVDPTLFMWPASSLKLEIEYQD